MHFISYYHITDLKHLAPDLWAIMPQQEREMDACIVWEGYTTPGSYGGTNFNFAKLCTVVELGDTEEERKEAMYRVLAQVQSYAHGYGAVALVCDTDYTCRNMIPPLGTKTKDGVVDQAYLDALDHEAMAEFHNIMNQIMGRA